ncbi:SafA/ExsA family spore coat assembly protein [Lentibacillus saliphilus]|uniref:SafA/ExsA family spore coat assembly protein n=1 Tax=Lentibacillus saliphilus TaxID=2737028 RepID=UPI00248487EF|nr:SafA/ExsA family spore coat assembly protein [Lentibacillus saliphilus]
MIRLKIHVVQKGDTLWEIAEKYGVSYEELKQLNTQLSNPDMIMPGMKIKVPSSSKAVKTKQMTKIEPSAKKPYKPMSPKPMPVIQEDDHEKPKKVKVEMPKPPIPKPPMPPKPPQPKPEAQPKPSYQPHFQTNMTVQHICMYCGQPYPKMPEPETSSEQMSEESSESMEMPKKPVQQMPMQQQMIHPQPIPCHMPKPPMPIHKSGCGCGCHSTAGMPTWYDQGMGPGNFGPMPGMQPYPQSMQPQQMQLQQMQQQQMQPQQMQPQSMSMPMHPQQPALMQHMQMPNSPYPTPPGYRMQYEQFEEEDSNRE